MSCHCVCCCRLLLLLTMLHQPAVHAGCAAQRCCCTTFICSRPATVLQDTAAPGSQTPGWGLWWRLWRLLLQKLPPALDAHEGHPIAVMVAVGTTVPEANPQQYSSRCQRTDTLFLCCLHRVMPICPFHANTQTRCDEGLTPCG